MWLTVQVDEVVADGGHHRKSFASHWTCFLEPKEARKPQENSCCRSHSVVLGEQTLYSRAYIKENFIHSLVAKHTSRVINQNWDTWFSANIRAM